MSRKEWTCLGFLLAATLVVGGCGIPGSKNAGAKPSDSSGKTASSRKNAQSGDLSPESSMRRDLQQLQERERQQLKTVEEMRTALSQGRGMVAGEEKKLAEIQSQIARYEDALSSYEKGAYDGGASRRAAVPANYAPQPRDNGEYRNIAAPAVRERPSAEEVLYNSRSPAPQPSTAPRVREEIPEKPFAGAPVGRARYPEQSQHSDLDENSWNPPANFFSNRAVPPRFDPESTTTAAPAAQPAVARQDVAPNNGSLRPTQQQPSRPAAASAAPTAATAARSAQAPQPLEAETHASPEDEVFVPDLRF